VTLEFRTSFTGDLGRVRDRALLKRVKKTIEEVAAAVSVLESKILRNSGQKVATIALDLETIGLG